MINKKRPDNPFFTGIQIPDEYFCDRTKETREIIDLIRNGNNVVMKAQRRIGKSCLIHHIINQEEIRRDYNTLYIDIFGTKNLNDFHLAFQNKLLNAPFAKAATIKRDFELLTKNINISLGVYNSITGSFSLPSIGTTPFQQPKIPMEQLFDFLEVTKKPNIIVIDEFQQIEFYPERTAAILRSFTQRTNNSKFIFSGSSSHMLTAMFQMNNQPFYKSAEPYDIKELPLDAYSQFCSRLFAEYDKEISEDSIKFLYYLFSGETAPMQETMNRVFRMVLPFQKCNTDIIQEAINDLLDNRDTSYREILNRIDRESTRKTLYCIAAMGIGENLTSSNTMKYYQLDNASSVQKSILSLLDEHSPQIRKIAKGKYVIDDRLFELWLAREGNYLDLKYSNAENRYIKQNKIEKPDYTPTLPKM